MTNSFLFLFGAKYDPDMSLTGLVRFLYQLSREAMMPLFCIFKHAYLTQLLVWDMPSLLTQKTSRDPF